MRASDRERQEAVERLRAAAAEGRLEPEELDQRLELALVARSGGELDALLHNLPTAIAAPQPRKPERRWLVLPIGGFERRGHWRVPERLRVIFLFGGVELDLSQAELPAEGAELTLVALIGAAELRVPPHMRIETGGFSLIGAHEHNLHQPTAPDAPRLRVRVYSLIGGIEIKTAGTGRPDTPTT